MYAIVFRTVKRLNCNKKYYMLLWTNHFQGRIQEFVLAGRPFPFHSSPSLLFLPSSFSLSSFLPSISLPFPLEAGPLKPARGFGECCKLPQWGPGPKANFMHFKVVRKPLVAICWVFVSACFTVERSKFKRDGVGSSPGGGEARGGTGSPPPFKSATEFSLHYIILHYCPFRFIFDFVKLFLAIKPSLWDPSRTRAIPERIRGVFTTRRYTNSRLPYLNLHNYRK